MYSQLEARDVGLRTKKFYPFEVLKLMAYNITWGTMSHWLDEHFIDINLKILMLT